MLAHTRCLKLIYDNHTYLIGKGSTIALQNKKTVETVQTLLVRPLSPVKYTRDQKKFQVRREVENPEVTFVALLDPLLEPIPHNPLNSTVGDNKALETVESGESHCPPPEPAALDPSGAPSVADKNATVESNCSPVSSRPSCFRQIPAYLQENYAPY